MKRKRQLIEHNMTRDVNTTNALLKAKVTLMMGAKPKKNTFSRAKLELILIIGLRKGKQAQLKTRIESLKG